MADLKDYRVQIDRIDRQMQSLFEERMAVSQAIGAWKKANGYPVYDAKREAEKLADMKARASSPENAEGIERLMQTVFEVSRELQKQ